MTTVHAVWRGLIVSVSFIAGLPEPLNRDVEHFSSTLLHVNILKMCGREGSGGAARN